MTIKKKVTYVDSEGFEFSIEPIEDTIKIQKTEGGYEARYLAHDSNAENPRKWDNLGSMVCWHNKYDLGDDHNWTSPESFLDDIGEYDTIPEYVPDEQHKKFRDKRIDKTVVMLPLYLYDHSGLTMRTTPYSCRWDSGQVGFIYLTHEDIKKEMARPKYKKGQINPSLSPIKRVTKDDIKRARKALVGEVETFDKYLTGDVYTIVMETYDEDKNQVDYDCVSGFYGQEDAEEELRGDGHF